MLADSDRQVGGLEGWDGRLDGIVLGSLDGDDEVLNTQHRAGEDCRQLMYLRIWGVVCLRERLQ